MGSAPKRGLGCPAIT